MRLRLRRSVRRTSPSPARGFTSMLLGAAAATFVALIGLSMPIVFALGMAGIAGLLIGGDPLQMLPSSLVSGAPSLGLLAVPLFLFARRGLDGCGLFAPPGEPGPRAGLQAVAALMLVV